MAEMATRNPDLYMADLRLILSQGRKRIGLLIGAGAPTSIRIDEGGASGVSPFLPDANGLTKQVLGSLEESEQKVIKKLRQDIGNLTNVENILTQVRKLSQAIGSAKVHNLDSSGYDRLANRICENIGKIVRKELPAGSNPFSDLALWISGTPRTHAVEIFTPNYDLLIEDALERARSPYFDGFGGSHKPFFDAASVATAELPSRWTRLWKLHGSLGWEEVGDSVVRTGSRETSQLIYPDHLKFDRTSRQPYSALFERLRSFLETPDTLLLTCGFSFSDAHICAEIQEGLATNSHAAVLAFQFSTLVQEEAAAEFARKCPSVSLYARDGAIINGTEGSWQPEAAPSEEWETIRRTFWNDGGKSGEFLLGDFAYLASFLKHIRAHRIKKSSDPRVGENDMRS